MLAGKKRNWPSGSPEGWFRLDCGGTQIRLWYILCPKFTEVKNPQQRPPFAQLWPFFFISFPKKITVLLDSFQLVGADGWQKSAVPPPGVPFGLRTLPPCSTLLPWLIESWHALIDVCRCCGPPPPKDEKSIAAR